MPAVSPKIIVNELIEAIQQSGGVASYISENVKTHPRKFNIGHAGNMFSLWVYVWTLTPGGRPSLPDEYRIQMTSAAAPLQTNPDGLTVLLGYYPDLKIFAGFDLMKHKIFTPGSPSVQIDISAIHSALQNGLSFWAKPQTCPPAIYAWITTGACSMGFGIAWVRHLSGEFQHLQPNLWVYRCGRCVVDVALPQRLRGTDRCGL